MDRNISFTVKIWKFYVLSGYCIFCMLLKTGFFKKFVGRWNSKISIFWYKAILECIVFFIIHIFHELSENPLYREMGILLHCREECKLVELNKGNLALLKMHIGTDPANSRQIHLWYVIFIQTLGNIYKDSRLIFISKDKKQVPQ